MSTKKSDLIFTVDNRYNIKITLRSLPHLTYNLDSTKLKYSNEIVQKDFNKWRGGNYDAYDEFPKKKTIVIKEEDRTYTFVESESLTSTEIMWAFFDEIKKQESAKKDSEYEPLMNADLKEQFEDTLRIIDGVRSFKVNIPEDLDGYQATEYKNLNALETKIAKLVEGFKCLDKETTKFADLCQSLFEKLNVSNMGLDKITDKFRDIRIANDDNSCLPTDHPFLPKQTKNMTVDEKVSAIVDIVEGIIQQYQFVTSTLRSELNEKQRNHELLLAVKRAENENLQAKYNTLNDSFGEIRNLWKDTCKDLDKVTASEKSANKKNEELSETLDKLRFELNNLKSELVKQSQNFTQYDLVSVDCLFSSIKPNLDMLNRYLTSNATGYIIGMRGCWFDSTNLQFNITQLLCNKSKSFIPFKTFKFTNTVTPFENDSPYVLAHDMLGLFNNRVLRFYYEEEHLLAIDENNFISKSINRFIDKSSKDMKERLRSTMKNISNFEIAEIAYKTNILIDLTDRDNHKFLNKIIEERDMDLISGEGYWTSPIMFNISKLTFRTIETPQPLIDQDDFIDINSDEVKTNDDNIKTNDIKKERNLVVSIDKYLKKSTEKTNAIVIHASNSSNTNYNTHLLLQFGKVPVIEVRSNSIAFENSNSDFKSSQ